MAQFWFAMLTGEEHLIERQTVFIFRLIVFCSLLFQISVLHITLKCSRGTVWATDSIPPPSFPTQNVFSIASQYSSSDCLSAIKVAMEDSDAKLVCVYSCWCRLKCWTTALRDSLSNDVIYCSLTLSVTHTHKHTEHIYVYISLSTFYHLNSPVMRMQTLLCSIKSRTNVNRRQMLKESTPLPLSHGARVPHWLLEFFFCICIILNTSSTINEL